MKILILCAAMGLLSGCGSVQVNDRMFVQMMGLSEDNGIYSLTVQISSGGEEDRSSAPVPENKILKGTGRSFSEAAENISRKNGKEVFFGHCGAIFADESILGDPEKLRNLLGNRVSVGCPVIYSENPESLAAAVDENGEYLSADAVTSILDKYSGDGILPLAALKTVCEAAEEGESAVLPRYDGAFDGSAVMVGGNISLLNLTESAAYNIISGGKNVSMTVLGGKAELSGIKSSVYFQSIGSGGESAGWEPAGGEYQVTVNADCTVSELGSSRDMSEYKREAENILAEAAENILSRAYRERFLDGVKGFEDVKYGNEDISFSVTVSILLRQ